MSTPYVSNRSSAGSGLGISYASLSPPSVSTTQVSTGFIASPPRSLPHIPSSRQNYGHPESPTKQNPYQPKVSLRPTHHRSESSRGFTSFSALPPATGRSTPFRYRSEERAEGSMSSRGEGGAAGLRRNTSNASTATAGSRLRKSRSSDLLRRLSARGSETVSGGKYVPLSGDDGERDNDHQSHPQPRGRSDTVSTVSAHPAQSPQTHEPEKSESSHHFMPSEFPAPPYRPHSSFQAGPSSHPPPQSHALARSQSQPQPGYYPDEAEEYATDPKRISDPSTGIHSQNHALFVAEKGGKMLAYSAEGIWSANSIASTPPVGSVNPQTRPAARDDQDLQMRPWSYSTESHQRPQHVRSLSEGATLARYGTLLHPASGGQRASTELGIMLGNKSRRLGQGKLLPPPELEAWKAAGGPVTQKVKLEAAKKRRARVEVDVVLERECVVEGGEVRGRMEVRVNGSKSEGLRIGGGKVRVVGYEDLSPTSRHIFYHHPCPLPLFAHPPPPGGVRSSLFGSAPDEDGFREVVPGHHYVPFCMRLPLSGGAKGAYTSPHPKGPSIRYVVVGSVKLLHPKTGKRSIAHFYRPIVILPYLNPGIVLAPCEEMVEVVERRGLGWSLGGAKGMVELRIALGRDVWVSGQRVWCEIGVRNESSKRIKSLTLALLQTVQTFLPDNDTAAVSTDKDGFPNADEALGIASTFRRKVAEESIVADEAEHGGGRVTGRSWWTGVESGQMGGWDLSLLIPNGLLTIPRSRLVEVTYTLRLTANGSSNLFVDVPLTLINFLSIDPPPMPGDGARFGVTQRNAQLAHEAQYGNLHPVASTAGGHYGEEGSLRSGESANGGIAGAARASSTTLHIDALLSAGRARAEAEAAGHYPDAQARVLAQHQHRQGRPESGISVYNNTDVFGQGQGTPLGGWANRASVPVTPGLSGGVGGSRPKGARAMSYLSGRSSNQPLSEEEEEEDDEEEEDEADRALLAAARREGRKMSLAALTRAAQRESDDYMRDDLISPMRETPPTGMWLPSETPYEEVFKVLGETPSMRSRSDRDAVGSPAPVPTIGSAKTRRSSRDEEAETRRLERLTIAEEQEALASTRGSSDENHQYDTEEEVVAGGYAEGDFRPAEQRLVIESRAEQRRSHEMIPEEEEPEDEDGEIGNETILEDLVAPRDDNTLRMTLPPHPDDNHPRSASPDAFEYNDQMQRSPEPALLGSLGSASGTGNTASSLRVPSRSGSGFDNMQIRSVDSEREAYIQQTRSVYGSFAASAISEQESEVGQVTQVVKRDLSIKTPSKTMKYRLKRSQARGGDGDDEADEEMDEDKLSPSRALHIPRSGSAPLGMLGGGRKHSHTPSPEKRASDHGGVSPKTVYHRPGSAPNIAHPIRGDSSSAPVAPSPLRDTLAAPSSIGRVFANRPSFSFNAQPTSNRETDIDQSPRGGNTYSLSPGPSPRSGFPSTLTAEPMLRQLSAHSSQLRNQVKIRPPSEEVPPLAPSVDGDSASSEGHGLESPPISSNPSGIDAMIQHQLGDQQISDKPLPSDPAKLGFNPVLDPNWRPGSHTLHTQVAFARTSFSAPDQHSQSAANDSPRRNRSRKGSRAAPSAGDHSVYSHEGETYASHSVHQKSRPSSPSGGSMTSHSSHGPMLSGVQSRLLQLEARDEALRKFSVASAASGGMGERERAGSGVPTIPRGSVGGYERERVGSGAGVIPRSSLGGHERERVGSGTGPLPRSSLGGAGGYERERVASIPIHRDSTANEGIRREKSNTSQRNSAPVEEGEAEKKVRKRRSYTTALGARPVRSASDDVLDRSSAPAAPAPDAGLGGTTYVTRRPYGTSPPVIEGDAQTGFGWQSPTRLEVSFSPPLASRPVTALQRNMSASSVSTTATTIEAALASRAGQRIGPTGPRSSPSLAAGQTRRIPQPPIVVDPYETTSPTQTSAPQGYSYSTPAYQNHTYARSPEGEQGGFGRYLTPGQAYGAEAYGSEQGSVGSRASGRNREWTEPEPVRQWVARGSQATDDSEGLL